MVGTRDSFPSVGDASQYGEDSSESVRIPRGDFGIFGWAFGDPQPAVEAKVRHFMKLSPRPMNQDEVNALTNVFVMDQRQHIKMYLSSAAAGVLLARARGFRLPFVKLNPKKYHELIFPSRMNPIIMGPWAKRLWFITRATAYGTIVLGPASVFTAGAGMFLFNNALQNDPRLAEFKDAIWQAAARDRNARDVETLQKVAPAHSTDELREASHKIRAAYEASMQRLNSGEGDAGALNPEQRKKLIEVNTARYEEAQRVIQEALERKENPVLAEKQRADYQALGVPGSPPPSSSTANTLGLPPRSQSQPGSEGTVQGWGASPSYDNVVDQDDFDDASPVARSARGRHGDAGGSAWDRVRQQAAKGQDPKRPVEASDDWGSSAAQKEGSEERRKAQQEFDELVERSRRER